MIMTLKAYDRTSGRQVHIGDPVEDFRGQPGILTRLERGESPGKSGKVTVAVTGITFGSTSYDSVPNVHVMHYDNVWNLRVVEEPDAGELPYEDSPGAQPATVTLTVDEWRDVRDWLRERSAVGTFGERGTNLHRVAEWINSKIMEADPAE